MNVFDLMFGSVGSALNFIFRIGYIPVESDFLELTEEQYAAFFRQCGETTSKIYMFAPSNSCYSLDDDYNEISCLDEDDLQGFLDAAELILQYCDKSNRSFKTTKEKLRYMASALPEAFSKDTPYEKYHHLSIDATD
ncbi:hypothetical protein [Bacteroides congonensis]|uniref:hypothetical protein n=1 Tax=Bacteroides congonensis TaxID=1871006 RepID=UPI000A6DA556|nr:hypothetical protein [Bacteroides congonensis]